MAEEALSAIPWMRMVVFALGASVVLGTVFSAIRTFVLPRSANDFLSRQVFVGMRRIFNALLVGARSYAARDALMAYYAPITLLVMPAVWLILVLAGYTAIYWALGGRTVEQALTTSGSCLFTLGFAALSDFATALLAFSEAAIGLALIALLIAYLPTIYSAFSQREKMVTLLEVRAGSPPSAVEMLLRYRRIHGLQALGDLWPIWEIWFSELDETHTSLGVLAFFRSPRPDRSWVTAAGAILDGASLVNSTVDIPHDPHADLCIRAGFLALRHIADVFRIPYDTDPHAGDAISVTRAEYDAVCERLAAGGVPLKPDREQAWRDFAGWRVNYDAVLLVLARLTMAPPAAWSSDRLPPSRGARK